MPHLENIRDILPSFNAFFLAVEKVKADLHRITDILEKERISYAVIGGNAVAAWVASVDESAVRATKDIDLLLNNQDMERVTRLFEDIGYVREDLKSLTIFVDKVEHSRRRGIHIVIAGEKIRPSYPYPAPEVSEVKRSKEGYYILDLLPLIKMKLISFRDKDRVHLADMLSVGLITEDIKNSLPDNLLEKLKRIESEYEEF